MVEGVEVFGLELEDDPLFDRRILREVHIPVLGRISPQRGIYAALITKGPWPGVDEGRRVEPCGTILPCRTREPAPASRFRYARYYTRPCSTGIEVVGQIVDSGASASDG